MKLYLGVPIFLFGNTLHHFVLFGFLKVLSPAYISAWPVTLRHSALIQGASVYKTDDALYITGGKNGSPGSNLHREIQFVGLACCCYITRAVVPTTGFAPVLSRLST
jgi:hypothetical protein